LRFFQEESRLPAKYDLGFHVQPEFHVLAKGRDCAVSSPDGNAEARMTLIADDSTVLSSGLAGDRAPQAIAFIHKLLQQPADVPFPKLLRELADVFEARSAGLAAPLSDSPIVQHHTDLNGTPPIPPWEHNAAILQQVRSSPSAVAVEADGSWLLTAVCPTHSEPGLLWLEAAARTWTTAEKAALSLAGQALGRLTGNRLDTADRQRWEQRAALQGRMENVAQVTGRLAHDFGNILTGILGFAELSLSQAPLDSPQRRYLSEVVQSAQHGAAWVRKLQTFSRRSRAKGPPSQLGATLAEETDRCRQAWGSTIALLVAPADTLPPVAVDAEAVREMLRQLLENAREAITDRGVVTLSARAANLTEHDALELIGNARPGRHVEITITDTGSGLSSETRRRLFGDVFFSTKNRQRGLGLAMVYTYLAANQGGLRFGPDPEQGTAVRVYLPVAADRNGTSPRGAGESCAPVLVVDDDPMVLEVVCNLLTQAGYRVQGTTEPGKAVDLFAAAAEPFRLVISDVHMPGMNGYEMTRRLRSADPRLHLLFISGHTDLSPADGQPRDFLLLKKPFESRALMQAVSAALAQHPLNLASSETNHTT
jgi:signal transduction histidine kinase/CheY-like chemotaxis protein